MQYEQKTPTLALLVDDFGDLQNLGVDNTLSSELLVYTQTHLILSSN